MSDRRPEWMPSLEKVFEVFNDLYNGDAEPTFGLHRSTGLRAQIAALEEMRERLGGYSKSVEGYCASKIAALRKELKG
jgi:hypothetical protein